MSVNYFDGGCIYVGPHHVLLGTVYGRKYDSFDAQSTITHNKALDPHSALPGDTAGITYNRGRSGGIPNDMSTTSFGSSNGYCKLQNGLILQWATYNYTSLASGNSQTTLAFPLTFPSACVGAWTEINTHQPQQYSAAANTPSRTSVQLNLYAGVATTNPGQVRVFALGY